jgi:hypothetical protein
VDAKLFGGHVPEDFLFHAQSDKTIFVDFYSASALDTGFLFPGSGFHPIFSIFTHIRLPSAVSRSSHCVIDERTLSDNAIHFKPEFDPVTATEDSYCASEGPF